jgi:hypothetical protein
MGIIKNEKNDVFWEGIKNGKKRFKHLCLYPMSISDAQIPYGSNIFNINI